MELIKQELFVDIEHLLKYKKSTDIKYSWAVGPFTIKNKSGFPMVEGLIRELGFEIEPSINYDPH